MAHDALTLRDILHYGRGSLVPREPISLYRYVELLVQLALIRKRRFGKVLEPGPGTYPVFGAWPRELFGRAAVVDYNPKVLDYCGRVLAGRDVERIELDYDRAGVLQSLGRKWDLVVSNGVLEHLRNDRAHIDDDIHAVLEKGGVLVCVTVLHKWLFNDWDRAVGHYRRYPPAELRAMFGRFSGVQLIQTSLIQELVRPLFFGRIRHLLSGTPEENNLKFGDEVGSFSRPPYAGVFWLVRWLLPVYLCVDWWLGRLGAGAIAIVVARK